MNFAVVYFFTASQYKLYSCIFADSNFYGYLW